MIWLAIGFGVVTWLAIVVLFLSLRIVGTKLGTMALDADDIARLAVDKSTENSVVLIRAGLARLTSDDPKTAKLVYQPPQAVMYADNLSDERKEEIRQEIEKMRSGSGVKIEPFNPSPLSENWVITSAGDEEIDGPAYASHPEASMFPWG